MDDEAGSDKTEADGRGKGQNGNEQESELEVGVSDNETVLDTEAAEDAGGVYDFKDNKTAGVITVTKIWDDNLTNEEREIPDIKISTAKPSKNPLGYAVTFHGNKDAGLLFDDGSDVNTVVYNSSGQIVDGMFKVPGGAATMVGWYTESSFKNRVVISEDGIIQIPLNDLDLWAKEITVELKESLYRPIPSTVTSVVFTDEIKPESASIIDVDADSDGGVVAWTEDDNTVMKVSTQIKGVKAQAAKNSGCMFYNRSKLTNIDFTMLDTQNVTNMSSMFYDCSHLTTLDLSPLDTQNVTDMSFMFSGCDSLTTLDLSSFNTQNVTDMGYMFSGCSGLTALDLSPLDTQNVTSMYNMFLGCSGLTALDLSHLDTQKVTEMDYIFTECNNLTTLKTGPTFQFVGTNYQLYGTWQNTAGETFTSGTFPSNVADTYTKISG